MYIPDGPIKTKEEDILGRAEFSQKLAESILSWKGPDSLVISISGEWGSGKSSVINLMKEYLSEKWNRPTVLEFNPWVFSGDGNLISHFFYEIAKELEIKNEGARDKEIAQKLRLYTKILDFVPASFETESKYKIFTIIGGLGLSFSYFTNPQYKIIFLILGLLLILISLFKSIIQKFAEYYEEASKIKEMSIFSLKEELKCDLSFRSRKLLIIIDDIDRLNNLEIKQIFQLIKVNTDLPNTVYLLSFDKLIVEEHLKENKISGRDYLKKIVEVDFDIPYVSPHKVRKVLLIELDKIFKTLPEYSNKYFDQRHWSNVYNSGFKNFFVTIRDVKRFCSSLKFNISLLYKERSIEVNPIDFTAAEAIRVFCPEFYMFMKSNKSLFTDTGHFTNTTLRINEINISLSYVNEKYKPDLESLIHILFPQFSDSIHPDDWQSTWNRELRICATDYFDSYFTLNAGGEEGLSQFEIDSVLNTLDNSEKLQLILCSFLKNNKIRLMLERLPDYTESEEHLPLKYSKNLIQAMFNISDYIPNKKEFLSDAGPNWEIMKIVYQILKRNRDKHENYEILKDTTINSESVSGPVETIFEIHRENDGNLILLESDYEELKRTCIEKIRKFNHEGKLLENPNFDRIVYSWKEWDDSEECQNFVNEFIKTDEGLIKFISKFTNTIFLQEGMYLESKRLTFKYYSLKALMDLEVTRSRLEALISTRNPKYLKNKDLIDLFLNDFDKKN